MKVVAFNGSPRANGNTAQSIKFVFEELEKEGIQQMMIPGSTYWNMTLSRDPGDVNKDEEGIKTFRNLGKNMAWLLKKTGA
jgi:multimeric flavodoxin WrbA